MDQKNRRKYREWREQALKRQADITIVARGRSQWIYLYKGESVPIEAMKVWVDKGEGIKEIFSFKDGRSPDECNLSMTIKNSKKLIYRDSEEELHGFGFDNAQTSLKRFCAYIKAANLISFVFAHADDNIVNIIEKIFDPESEVVSKFFFEISSREDISANSGEVLVDELFFE